MSTSLKKRTSLGGGGSGNAASCRAPAGGGLVATALGFTGSVPDEVARKVKRHRLFFSLANVSLCFFFFYHSHTFTTTTSRLSMKKTTGGRETRAIAAVEEER